MADPAHALRRITASSAPMNFCAARRRRVPAVGERVDEHAIERAPGRQVDERVEMPLVAVDAVRRQQTDQVERDCRASQRSTASSSGVFSKKSPSVMLLSMRVRSW